MRPAHRLPLERRGSRREACLHFSTPNLLPACRVLFGADAVRDAGFLVSLTDAMVISAFRRRALETHPDRAGSAGVDRAGMTRRFQEVSAARELLTHYLATRRPPPIANARAAPPKAPPQSPPKQQPPKQQPPKQQPPKPARPRGSEHFWTGRVPDRQLLLAEFLFYFRRISLQALDAALLAHRARRRPVGAYFAEIGMVSARELDSFERLKHAHNAGRARRRAG